MMYKDLIHRIIFTVFIFCFCLEGIGADRLSNQHIVALAAGNDGYLWVGTRRGLNRFNGSTYKYYLQDDSLSLTSDRVLSLLPDTDNRLWVGTDAGINLITNSTVTRRSPSRFYPITSMVEYGKDYILYSCTHGLGLYDKSDGSTEIVFHSYDFIYGAQILVNYNNDILVAPIGQNNEFYVFDSSFEKKATVVVGRQGVINHMAIAYNGDILVAKEEGLTVLDGATYDELNEEDERFRKALGIDSDIHILFLERDENRSAIIMGIKDRGIYSMDSPEKGWNVKRILSDISLKGVDKATCLVKGNDIWLGTIPNGDIVYKTINDNYVLTEFNEIYGKDIIKRIQTWKDNLAVVACSRHIFLLNTITGSYRDVTPGKILDNEIITYSFIDRSGNLWLITNYSRISKYAVSWSGLSEEGSTRCDRARLVWEDSEGNLDILANTTVMTIDKNLNTVSTVQVNAKSEFLRFGTSTDDASYFVDAGNIYRLGKDKLFANMGYDIPMPNCLSVSNDGDLWVGTFNSGIYHISSKDGSVRRYTMEDGLPDNAIRSITTTNSFVWLSTRNTVTAINSEGHVSILPNVDLLNIDFIINGLATGSANQVILAGQYQVFEVFPREIDYTKVIPIDLDELHVNNKTYRNEGKIVLSHNENLLSFHYSAKDFAMGPQLNYSYMLVGHDNQWVNNGSGKDATYSNLKSGKYSFKVKVQTPNGAWQDPQTLCSFRIRPSFGWSIAARIFYLLFIVGGLMYIWNLSTKYRMSKQRLEFTEREKQMDEQLNKDKNDFFINISHEYRTPVTLIAGPVRELLESETLSEKDRHLASLIEGNAERLMKLTDQAAGFGSFTMDADKLHTTYSDLSSMVERVLSGFEYAFTEKNMTLEKDIPDTFYAQYDKDKVEKIVYNLVSNALKYTPEGGLVKVAVRSEETEGIEYATVSVSDTGIGISAENVDRIFERYERIEGKVDDKRPTGLGIGLSLVQYLATIHKGKVEMVPNTPKGSTFRFTFPSDSSSYTQKEIWKSTSSGLDSIEEGKETILVVEDSMEMREYICSLLSGTYNTLQASDGEAALLVLEQQIPDIIISDIMMPYKNGIELLKDIRSNKEYSHIPVVLLTAKNEVKAEVEGLENGADVFMKKPFDKNILMATLKNLTEKRSMIQRKFESETAETIAETVETVTLNSHDKIFLEKVYGLIDENISDESFNVTAIAQTLGMSRGSLFSKFKTLTGKSPQQFLGDYRLNKAKELLQTHEYNISEVAYKVGFSTLNSLSRAFKNKFGVPPSSI